MSITQILIVATVAIIVLGPQKLPGALVELAKLFKSLKKQVDEVQSAFRTELKLKELQDEATRYTQEISKLKESATKKLNLDDLKNEASEQLASVEAALKGSESSLTKAAKTQTPLTEAKASESSESSESSERPKTPLTEVELSSLAQADMAISGFASAAALAVEDTLEAREAQKAALEAKAIEAKKPKSCTALGREMPSDDDDSALNSKKAWQERLLKG